MRDGAATLYTTTRTTKFGLFHSLWETTDSLHKACWDTWDVDQAKFVQFGRVQWGCTVKFNSP